MVDMTLKAVWLITLVVASAIRVRYTRGYRKMRIIDARGTLVDRLLMVLAFLGMQAIPVIYLVTSWLDFADYRWPTSIALAAGLVGAAISGVGLWLLWRSHVDLGRSWTPQLEIIEEHTLVTHGVFGRMRHPMYTAHALWAIGQGLLLQNWIAGWAFLASQLPIFVYRIPREEEMMIEHFGDEYREYMKRTGGLIPRLGS